jgi:hypothetical protein
MGEKWRPIETASRLWTSENQTVAARGQKDEGCFVYKGAQEGVRRERLEEGATEKLLVFLRLLMVVPLGRVSRLVGVARGAMRTGSDRASIVCEEEDEEEERSESSSSSSGRIGATTGRP